MKSLILKNHQRIRVMAIHGFTGESFDFAPLYEGHCSDMEWRFVNLPGHFRELNALSLELDGWEMFCQRIQETVNEAAHDDVCLVAFGYSMGARLLLRAQLEHQWKWARMVLVGMNPGIEDLNEKEDRLRNDRTWADKLRYEGIEGFVDEWMQQGIIASQTHANAGTHDSNDIINERVRRKKLLNPELLANALMEYSPGRLPAVWDRLEEIDADLHLIAGENDEKYCNLHQRMEQMMPAIQTHTIPDAGHAPHLEHPESFAQCFRGLLTCQTSLDG